MKMLTVLLFTAGLFTAVAFAQNWQPNVTDARFETRSSSGDLDSQIRAVPATWFGYAVKTTRGDRRNCCWNGSNQCGCSLEEGRAGVTITGTRSNGPVQLEGSDALAVLFRVANNNIEKIQVYSLSCPLDAGGLPFVWLTGVSAKASLAHLEKLVRKDTSGHIADGAIFAISQHDDPEADAILEKAAKTESSAHVRGQALFWLAQKAGDRASSIITDAIKNDPDTEVKKRAVFALSQLPRDEAVPKLIEIARSQRNPEVRKQAFFWLGQSKDPRALSFIEEVLAK
ncbi:MAG: HEAT repeat domain-containing protein [Bryobacteraceae bacterium]